MTPAEFDALLLEIAFTQQKEHVEKYNNGPVPEWYSRSDFYYTGPDGWKLVEVTHDEYEGAEALDDVWADSVFSTYTLNDVTVELKRDTTPDSRLDKVFAVMNADGSIQYFARRGFFDSYNGIEWHTDGTREVFPKQVQRTIYEP